MTARTDTRTFDGVSLHVLHNALANIAAEMGIVTMRTSYSPIFNEGLDFSTVLLNRAGEMIAEKNYVPSMMGAAVHSVRWTLEEKGEAFFEPGDVVVHNDPYRGGCHLPEHMVMKPLYSDGELVGFAGCIGHISEVGGKAPGGFAADASEVYQEGLRLPPVKLMRSASLNEDVWSILFANHRTPRVTWGDLNAMIGSLNVAEDRLGQLIRRYGREQFRLGVAELIDYSERRMRAEIDALPDGEYPAAMCVEDDGLTAEPFRVQVAVVIRGDQIIFDFTGSDGQVPGAMNATYVVALAAAYNATFCATDPDMMIPRNSGCYRPIKVIAPAGTVVNVQLPGSSIGGNTDLQPKLVDLLLNALSLAVPERTAAASGGSTNNLLLGGINPETGEYVTVYLFDGCGGGATMFEDGNSAEIARTANCRNTPVEILEHRYPIDVLEYSMLRGSGGAGNRRGGDGVRRTIRLRSDMRVSALFDRSKIPPAGLRGGADGRGAQLTVRRKGDSEFTSFAEAFGVPSPTKFSDLPLRAGDEIRYETPGGGGWGAP
jgi:N-methylhydantoinase B